MQPVKVNHRKNVANDLKTLAQREALRMNLDAVGSPMAISDDATNPYAFVVSVKDGEATRKFRVIVKELD